MSHIVGRATNIVATREANALLPSLVQLFVAPPPQADPGACSACAGKGNVWWGAHLVRCTECRGSGWPNGVNPFEVKS